MTRWTGRMTATCALTGALTLAGGAAFATQGTASAPPRHLVLHPAHHTDLDLGARGPSAGDVQLDTASIRERGHAAGTATNTCQVFSATSRQVVLQCRLDLVFSTGQLVAEGTVITAHGGSTYRMAVTGGTGRYARARGQLSVHPGGSDISVDLHATR